MSNGWRPWPSITSISTANISPASRARRGTGREVRAIGNSVRSASPGGLYFIVLKLRKRGRYPRAALSGVRIYHYDCVRSEEEMNEKTRKIVRQSLLPADYDYADGKRRKPLRAAVGVRCFYLDSPCVRRDCAAEDFWDIGAIPRGVPHRDNGFIL
jgi:hypothetical protein